MKWIKPLQLGNKTLPSNIFYAPLAGCSDFSFRRMSSLYRPGLMYCEMVKMDALIRNDANTFRLLDYLASMRPIGAQLCGSKPELAGPCAKILEDLGFDVIDLNCGCPVDKVTKDGSGSGLLKNPIRIGEILAEMVQAVSIPVTVKIRAGWDDSCLNAVEITKIAESAGAKAIAIHGRTRAQAYKGNANWDHIKACKEVANSIQVIGNGDVFTAADALEMFNKTRCDAVLVSRGTMGQPWIADSIYRLDQGLSPHELTKEWIQNHMMQHFDCITAHQNDRRSLIDLRKVACWYLKALPGTKKFKEGINRSKTIQEARQWLDQFCLEEVPSF